MRTLRSTLAVAATLSVAMTAAPTIAASAGTIHERGATGLAAAVNPATNALIDAAKIDNYGFALWASLPNVQAVAGDFDNDGCSDIALAGGAWSSTPIAYSNCHAGPRGTFTVVNNIGLANFPKWATYTGAKLLAGDFNHDGRDDLALSGGSNPGGAGWVTIPVALAPPTGRGMFSVVNRSLSDFPAWSRQSGVKTLVGDFDKDGCSDIALTGGKTAGGVAWDSIPVAFCDPATAGAFTVVNNLGLGAFGGWAATSGVQATVGDFDFDGRSDIAITGGGVWKSVPIAYANGLSRGPFTVVNNIGLPDFPYWSRLAGAKFLGGDFDGDHRDDLALSGGSNPGDIGWLSVPVAFAPSSGRGMFSVINRGLADFPALSRTAGVKQVVGDFDGDGRSDIGLTGAATWQMLPIAFGLTTPRGSFAVTTQPIT